MPPAIKLVLALPGEKVTLAKLINGFCKDFLAYLAANMETGINIVPLFRDVEDPVDVLEKKMVPFLKIPKPSISSALSQFDCATSCESKKLREHLRQGDQYFL